MKNKEVRSADEILQEVMKKYEKDPRGWHVFVSSDRIYPTFLITSPKESWMIKIESRFKPYPLGKGIKLDTKIKVPFHQPTYGFRPLSPEDIKKLFLFRKKPQELKSILDSLLRKPPSPLSEIRTPGVLGGPISFSDLSWISEEQRKLEQKLTKELEKHIYRKYSMYI